MNVPSTQATRLDAIGGRYDPWLFGAMVVLACLGVVMVASSSIAIGENLGVGPFHYLVRHLIFLGLGTGLAGWVMNTELKTIEKYNQWLLLACFVLLVLVFAPVLGSSVNGARRWLNLGVSKFQAVEAVKVMFIVWLASYLVRFSGDVAISWSAMLKPLGVSVALVVALLLQPDFGSASLLLAITAGMMVLGGGNLLRMLLPIVIGLLSMAIIAIQAPYRVIRFTSFVDPWADQQGAGYQLSNALMAVGRGEWFGVGLGASVQKLSYLPEAHTDFIFAVIAEELGFVGVCAVIGLYALLVGRIFWIGLRCIEMRRHFAGYCAFGVALWISMQSFVSIGVNLGILPTKGLTLPLISSGGSSVLMTCVAMGLVLRVSYELDRAERQVAKLRSENMSATAPVAGSSPSMGVPETAPMPVAARGTSRMKPRIEPVFGGTA